MTNRTVREGLVWTIIAFAALAPRLAAQERTQAELARALRSDDRDTVAFALAEVPVGYHPDDELGWMFRPGYEVTDELAAALAYALDREARLHLDGCTVAGIGGRHRELVLELMHAAVALRDPVTIPALVQVSCTGGTVHDALMGFGPMIVPDLVEWARAPDAAAADITGSVSVLSTAVDRWGEAMDAEVRSSVKDVALQFLGPTPERFEATPWQGEFVLNRAITLASTLRDADLLAILEEIAEEGHEGLDKTDPERAAQVRENARRGVEGSLVRRR